MDQDTLALFQRKAIKSKWELFASIDAYLKRLEDGDDPDFNADFYTPALVELICGFKNELARCDLMYLDGPFEAYEITITSASIYLESIEYTTIDFDEDGEIESSEASVYPVILEVDVPFITLEEFAKRCAVDASIALGWITSQKIKCAKREVSGWYVAATQGFPSDETESGEYVFIGEDGDLGSVVPLAKNAVSLHAFPRKEADDTFDVMMTDSDMRRVRCEQMDSNMLRSIEDELIRSPNVVFVKSLVVGISEKAVPGYSRSPFLDLSQKQIAGFISCLKLPDETKKVLNAMARSGCGEHVFLSTLEKLTLHDEFQAFVKETTRD